MDLAFTIFHLPSITAPSRDNDKQLDGRALYNSLVELLPDLKDQVVAELVAPNGFTKVIVSRSRQA